MLNRGCEHQASECESCRAKRADDERRFIREMVRRDGIVTAVPAVEPILSLRDQFAMAALTGLLACPLTDMGMRDLARDAYSMADIMLAAREDKGG